jgi:hypothetical protein
VRARLGLYLYLFLTVFVVIIEHLLFLYRLALFLFFWLRAFGFEAVVVVDGLLFWARLRFGWVEVGMVLVIGAAESAGF